MTLSLQDIQTLKDLSPTAKLEVKRGVLVEQLKEEVATLQSIQKEYNKTTDKEVLSRLEEKGNFTSSLLKVLMEEIDAIDSELNA
jgi:hypothetical protein